MAGRKAAGAWKRAAKAMRLVVALGFAPGWAVK